MFGVKITRSAEKKKKPFARKHERSRTSSQTVTKFPASVETETSSSILKVVAMKGSTNDSADMLPCLRRLALEGWN